MRTKQLTKSVIYFILSIMKQQKIGKLNILGSAVAFLVTVYIAILYILLMAGSGKGNIAYEITTDYASYWMLRFVVCILMYVACAVNLFSIPAYFILKFRNSISDFRKGVAIAQVAASVLILVFVIMFWSAQGPVFITNAGSPFATAYRISELILSIIMIGAVLLTIFYSANDDQLIAIKKSHNRKLSNIKE